MRISLLLEREPFGSILEKTLTTFWSQQLRRETSVQWHPGSAPKNTASKNNQVWLANIYLNAIFTPSTTQEIFDPVKKEFSRNLSWWKRPFQRAYVTLASSKTAARLLSQAWLSVTPPVPNAKNLLIVAGNHKIRILDRYAGVAYSILKAGFPPHFITREIETRKLAEKLGLPVPRLEEVAEDNIWFRERYIIGAPINRLKDSNQARQALDEASQAIKTLTERTKKEESLRAYVTHLRAEIEKQIKENHLLGEAQKQALLNDTGALVAQVETLAESVDDKIQTAITHGDFQPGNILYDDGKTWLIDWEYASRRQTNYDMFVYHMRARTPVGLSQRLRAFETMSEQWPWVEWQNEKERRLQAGIFLLEETDLKLKENANLSFTRLGGDLLTLQREISLWAREGQTNL